ncbi:MAG: hypothetical protein Q9222_001524 [Ikaeria aurantiellina]
MTWFHRARFEIISGDKSKPIHGDPDARLSHLTQQSYIEAVTGELFGIRVSLASNFDFAGSDAVRVIVCFDNNKTKPYIDIKWLDWLHYRKQSYVHFKTLRRYCPETNEWQNGYLSFGKLQTSDADELGTSLHDLQDLGSIRIVYQRINYVDVVGPVSESSNPRTHVNLEPVSKLPERALKGKAIDSTVQSGMHSSFCSGDIATPVLYSWGTPAGSLRTGGDGEHSIPVQAYFSYSATLSLHLNCCADTLQMLGIIPLPAPTTTPFKAGYALAMRHREPATTNVPATLRTNHQDPHCSTVDLRRLPGASLVGIGRQASTFAQPGIKLKPLSSGSKIKRERDDEDQKPKIKRENNDEEQKSSLKRIRRS